MRRGISIIVTLFVLTFSCKHKERAVSVQTLNDTFKEGGVIIRNDSLASLLEQNKQFFSDSLLKDNIGVIEHYFSTYQPDSCGVVTHKKPDLKEEFEGIRMLKGIRAGKQRDTVFVMPSFNFCDAGNSYCFYDKTLPRLATDSYCCQPDNLFVVEDIDEDGVREIGIYYSSCSSRYKSLRIFSLKGNNWKEIGISTFDVLTKDPSKVKFENLVKKQSKNKFKMCNFEEGKTEWELVTME